MKSSQKKRHTWGSVLQTVLLLSMLLWFLTSIGNLHHDSDDEMQRQLETALRRAAAACYAAEGVYPPTLEYLTAQYGIQIADEYIVFYDTFASNLMPDITVLKKGEK